MKYLKLFENYNNVDIKELIVAWLSAIGVDKDNYEIHSDLSITLKQSMDIATGFITKIPVKIRKIDCDYAYFTCMENKLTTLENFPENFDNRGTEIESDYGEITYARNPCSEDENQLKWLHIKSMSKGAVYNILGQVTYQFVFPMNIMDDYWDGILDKEPNLKLLEDLNVVDQIKSSRSNQISKKLYDKYEYLKRVKKTGLLDLNK
jgi:hypothetical protein